VPAVTIISNLDKLADQIAILADGATVTAMVTGNHTMAETGASAALALMDTAERQTGSARRIAATV